jgi:hypothetical protein
VGEPPARFRGSGGERRGPHGSLKILSDLRQAPSQLQVGKAPQHQDTRARLRLVHLPWCRRWHRGSNVSFGPRRCTRHCIRVPRPCAENKSPAARIGASLSRWEGVAHNDNAGRSADVTLGTMQTFGGSFHNLVGLGEQGTNQTAGGNFRSFGRLKNVSNNIPAVDSQDGIRTTRLHRQVLHYREPGLTCCIAAG